MLRRHAQDHTRLGRAAAQSRRKHTRRHHRQPDITERRRIADELRKSVKEIEDLYDHAPCGYHSLDENGVVTGINHTELAWLGFSRDEVIGKLRFPDLLTPSSLQTFQENFPRFKQNGYVHDLEFELKRKDGSLLPVLLSATAIYDPSGRYVMSRSTLFDLTDRKNWNANWSNRHARIC